MITYDAGSGTLALDGRTLQGLLARLTTSDDSTTGDAAQEEPNLFDLAEAERAGAYVGQTPVPELAHRFAIMADPWLVVDIELTGLDEPVGHRIWLRPEGGAGVADAGEGHYRLGGLHPSSLPAVLIRLARLGPRPRHGLHGVQPLPEEVIDIVRRQGGQSATEELTRLLSPSPVRDAVAAGQWRCVTMTTHWSPHLTPDQPPRAEAIVLLDTPVGLARFEPRDTGLEIIPTTMSTLWPELILLTQPAEAAITGPAATLTTQPRLLT
ncbi:hypothetical protein SAMN05421595_1317 [Austwickia chelonae]|uniref:Uncharacterized protein n=1 Tax=Austwickia chelonae NBRC 105200 TaxID=1184607 RepID=K6ULR9_9MICO|nr:hypothetical protein [Austwickia chelonae]GAB77481.1 hypothetical protein AUCHE_05_03930 [Austwickia chelonae NBRC 105200]SEW11275.1 hypothetical protein SAMN05421595_1317 [Austwickia chelonae]